MKRRNSRRHLLLTLMVCGCTKVTHAQSCEPHWSDQFPAAFLNGAVNALATFDDGTGDGSRIYVGGGFTTGGEVELNHIGELDGNVWMPLSIGMDNDIFALSAFDEESGKEEFLIAGGDFTMAGSVHASHIAKWDGTRWSPMGAGLNEIVRALQTFDDGSGKGSSLYAGGSFTESGNTAVNYIARWDGTDWMPLGDGLDNPVAAMAVFDDGSGDGPVLFVGGFFTKAGGGEVNFIAKWDGEHWSAVGKGMDSAVRSLVVFDDGSGPALYAGGSFTNAGGVTANRIAKWDGLSWSALGTGVDGPVWALSVSDDGSGVGAALYAGGFFGEAGGVEAGNIARWDGATWSPLGNGVNSFATAILPFDDGSGNGPELYVGGSFNMAGAGRASRLAKWDGSAWSAIGAGMTGGPSADGPVVYSLQEFDDNSGDGPALYAGGKFTSAGGEATKRIARWNGDTWASVGGGVDGPFPYVFSLTVDDDGADENPALYAGGYFTTAGGVRANSVARWDGTSWSPLGTGVDGLVLSLTVFDDGTGAALYVGGYFHSAGDIRAEHIAKWDGTSWSALNSGLSGARNPPVRVWTLADFDDGAGRGPALYAGGNFTTAGGVPAYGVARWNGERWSAVGTGFDGQNTANVFALTVYDDGNGPALYAGGGFELAGNVEVNGLARWDGKEWSPLGGGTDGVVTALDVFDDGIDEVPALHVGGSFFMAGNVAANHIARWNGRDWSALASGMGGFLPIVWALRSFDDGSGTGPALFAGGEFAIAGGQSSSHIAKWIVCPPQVPGDLDGDGIVGVSDLLILLANWGPCDDCDNCPADLDDDCAVRVSDLLTLLGNWG